MLNCVLSAILFVITVENCNCAAVPIQKWSCCDITWKTCVWTTWSTRAIVCRVFYVCFSKCDCTYICGKIANCSKFPHIKYLCAECQRVSRLPTLTWHMNREIIFLFINNCRKVVLNYNDKSFMYFQHTTKFDHIPII